MTAASAQPSQIHAARPAAPAAHAAAPTVDLLGVRVHAVTERGAIDHILGSLDEGRGGWVITPNLEILRQAVREPEVGELLREATLVVPDGMPLIWASRLQRTPLPERVAGSTMASTLSAAAAARGRSIFLLGGDPGVAEEAAKVLEQRFPGVCIAGHHCPPMGFESNDEAMRSIEQAVASARPDIVYVALGSPKQERLIRRLRPLLPGAWWLGVGISLSFLCGRVQRAPRWMQRVGLEWFHRFLQEPRRLAKRYFVHGVPFAVELLVRSALRTPPKESDR